MQTFFKETILKFTVTDSFAFKNLRNKGESSEDALKQEETDEINKAKRQDH